MTPNIPDLEDATMDEDKVPSPQSEPANDTRTVRDRTLAHLDSLMRLTTVGAGIALACSAQLRPQPRRPQPCDPAPFPSARYCENPGELLARGSMSSSAVWETTAGAWFVRLVLNASARDISFAGLSSEEVTVTGATLPLFPSGTGNAPHQHVEFVLWPTVNEKQVTVELPVSCYGKAIPLKFRLDISRPPAERGFVPVTLVKSSVLQNSVVPLKLPATYTNSQVPADQLQLNVDNSFSLQEAGQTYRGTFVANGSTLELAISGGAKTTATIQSNILQGNSLTDNSGRTWVLRKQTAVAINLGDSIDRVVAAMGQPDRAAMVANKVIYVYKDLKITFVDGKVSDIQ
jgi:hypothetical protein